MFSRKRIGDLRKCKLVATYGIYLEVLTKTMNAFSFGTLSLIMFELITPKTLRNPKFSVMELESYYDINSVGQHSCFFITQVNYIGYMFRLLNSHLQTYSFTHRDPSVFTSVNTLGSQCVHSIL